MSDQQKKKEITFITCGPQCLKNEEHDWDGPVVELNNGASTSCSKCGKLSIDVSLWELP